MKKRYLLISVAVIAILILGGGAFLFDYYHFEDNNEVFTKSALEDVESAYITTHAEPVAELDGRDLNRLCRTLSSLELESVDEPPAEDDIDIEEVGYGLPWRLVMIRSDGSTVSFRFSDDEITLLASEAADSEELEPHYEAASGDTTVQELILSYFDLDDA